MDIETRIKGIPALVRVERAHYTRPNHRAESDWDYYGGWELDYTICDRNGRPAEWLSKKLSTKEIWELEQEIIVNAQLTKEYA